LAFPAAGSPSRSLSPAALTFAASRAERAPKRKFLSLGLLQGDAHQAVGARLEALPGDRGAQHVAQQRLAPPGVKSARPRGRV
jgi:hypothetical protein